MKVFLSFSVLMLACVSALAGNNAPNVFPGEQITSAAGACHESKAADVRLSWSALNVRNISTTSAVVVCSPAVDTSPNGTTMFGAVLTNTNASNITMTCVAQISSGGNGAKSVSRSVIVGPKTSARIGWNAADMGYNTLFGGQVGFACTLPPGTWLSWVWSANVHN